MPVEELHCDEDVPSIVDVDVGDKYGVDIEKRFMHESTLDALCEVKQVEMPSASCVELSGIAAKGVFGTLPRPPMAEVELDDVDKGDIMHGA